MNNTPLSGHQRKTLAAILRHPAPHNVEWHDAIALLHHLGKVRERHGGGYDVTIGTDHIRLGQSHAKDLDGDDMRDLRDLLTKVGVTPDGVNGATAPHARLAQAPGHCIVLIDHQHAKLFGLGGADGDPSAPRIHTSDDDDGLRRRLEHKQGNDDHDGGHAAEEDDYYESVSIDLKPAQRIVILSDGKGRSNAGAYLVDYLTRHHPAIAGRIVARERVDISHMSDGEIIAAGVALLAAG